MEHSVESLPDVTPTSESAVILHILDVGRKGGREGGISLSVSEALEEIAVGVRRFVPFLDGRRCFLCGLEGSSGVYCVGLGLLLQTV